MLRKNRVRDDELASGRLVGEYDPSGNLIQELVWLNDIPVATLRTDQGGNGVGVFYLHTDHLSSPTKITRPSDNQIIWRWDHDPYGNGAPSEDPDGNGLTLVMNLRFPGQYADQETGLLYNYFRDYDPATGRYVQSDPLGIGGGVNTYAYANGSPGMFTDPRGLLALDWSETWSESADLGKGRGGLTEGWIKNVKCGCTGSGSCWTLSDCSARLHVKVQTLASAWGAEAKFYRKAEAEHVADFQSGFGQIFGAGKAAEDSIKGMQFSSKTACETHANKVISAALWKATNDVAKASGETYDRGRHTWYSHYRLFNRF